MCGSWHTRRQCNVSFRAHEYVKDDTEMSAVEHTMHIAQHSVYSASKEHSISQRTKVLSSKLAGVRLTHVLLNINGPFTHIRVISALKCSISAWRKKSKVQQKLYYAYREIATDECVGLIIVCLDMFYE